MPPSPISQNDSSSPRNTMLLIGSILVFVTIVGITLYLILQNQEESELSTTNEPESTNEATTLADRQKLEKYGVICRLYNSIDDALAEPEVACELNLSEQNISEIPDEITDLQNLNSINLSNNNLTEFPEILYSLPNLVSIDLSNNDLTSVPEDLMTRLPNLQSLKLEGNELSTEDVKFYAQITPSPIPQGVTGIPEGQP